MLLQRDVLETMDLGVSTMELRALETVVFHMEAAEVVVGLELTLATRTTTTTTPTPTPTPTRTVEALVGITAAGASLATRREGFVFVHCHQRKQ